MSERQKIYDYCWCKSFEGALTQNPASVSPSSILAEQRLLEAYCVSFDQARHVGQVVVSASVAEDVVAFFQLAEQTGFVIHRVVPAASPDFSFNDNELMVANVSSGFNYRNVPDRPRLSWHAYGRAFDINPALNPFVHLQDAERVIDPPGAVWRPGNPGVLDPTHALVVFMRSRGWRWGGDWITGAGRSSSTSPSHVS